MGMHRPVLGGTTGPETPLSAPRALGAIVAALAILAAAAPPPVAHARPQEPSSAPSAPDYREKSRLLREDPANRDLVASDLVKDSSPEARRIVENGLMPGGSEDVALALVKAVAYHRDLTYLSSLLLLHGVDARDKVRSSVRDALMPNLSAALDRRLLEIARDPNQSLPVRKSAVRFLAAHATYDREVVEGLVLLLQSSGEIFRTAAGGNLVTEALGKIAPENLGSSAEAWRRWWDEKKLLSDAEILGQVLKKERERMTRYRKDAVDSAIALVDAHRTRKGEEAAYLALVLEAVRGVVRPDASAPPGDDPFVYPELQIHGLARLRELALAVKDRTDVSPELKFGSAADVLARILADPRSEKAVVVGAVDALASVATLASRAGSDAAARTDSAARAIAAVLDARPPEEVAIAAVKALGRMKSALATGPLLVRLREPAAGSDSFPGGGTNGGAAMNGAPPGHAPGASPLREEIVLALGEIGSPGVPEALIEVLSAGDAEPSAVRGSAAIALGRLRAPSAVPALEAALLGDKEPKVRWRAADALAQIPGEAAESALVKGLADPAKEVRKQCAAGLGVRKSRPAIEGLTRLLADPDDVVRETALASLGAIGDPGPARSILLLLEDPSDKVALAAQRAFVAVLSGGARALLDEVNALVEGKKEKLALDILRLAREAMDAEPAKWARADRFAVSRAYLDRLVATGIPENRDQAIRIAGELSSEASGADAPLRNEMSAILGRMQIDAGDYAGAIQTLVPLSESATLPPERLAETDRDLARAYLESGRADGALDSLALGLKVLIRAQKSSAPEAVRADAQRIGSEIRERYTRGVLDLLADGVGTSSSSPEKWARFETFAGNADFVMTLLRTLRETRDPVYYRSVARALKSVAPDGPVLSDGATGVEREKEIEALERYFSRRFNQ